MKRETTPVLCIEWWLITPVNIAWKSFSMACQDFLQNVRIQFLAEDIHVWVKIFKILTHFEHYFYNGNIKESVEFRHTHHTQTRISILTFYKKPWYDIEKLFYIRCIFLPWTRPRVGRETAHNPLHRVLHWRLSVKQSEIGFLTNSFLCQNYP